MHDLQFAFCIDTKVLKEIKGSLESQECIVSNEGKLYCLQISK